MWSLISRIITIGLTSTNAETKLLKLLSNTFLHSNKIQKVFNYNNNPFLTLYNPEKLSLFLKTLLPEEGKVFIKTFNTIEIQTLEKTIYKFDKKSYKNKTETLLKDIQKGNSGWIQLSSSWINKGRFEITHKNKLTGILSISLKTGKGLTYHYPSVPYEVWYYMKEAKGSHGTGAGSAFWKYWLRSWLPSKLRNHINKSLKQKKIDQNTHDDILRNVINKKSSSFYRNQKITDTSQINKQWYNNLQSQRKGRIQALKSDIEQNIAPRVIYEISPIKIKTENKEYIYKTNKINNSKSNIKTKIKKVKRILY